MFNLLLRDHLLSLGFNMTRVFTAYFMLFFFCILLGKSRYRYFGLGLLSTLILFTQQDQFLAIAPFLVYALLTADVLTVQSRILHMGAGALMIIIPIFGYFAIHHALVDFWEVAFKFNFATYIAPHKSWGDHFRTIKRVLDNANYELPFMIALVLGIAALFLQNSRKGLVLAALAALFLTMVPEYLGGRLDFSGVLRDFPYYFLPLSSSICILLFTVFAFTEDRVLAGRRAQATYAALLCCSLIYTALQHGTHLIGVMPIRWFPHPSSLICKNNTFLIISYLSFLIDNILIATMN